MNEDDPFDAQVAEQESELLTALIRAYQEAANAIDIDALADAIATGDEEQIAIALQTDEGLQSGLDTALGDAFFFVLLGGIVLSMKRFATQYGSRVDTLSEAARIRSDLRRNIIEPMSRRAYEATQVTLQIMRDAGFTPKEIATGLQRSIGMAPDQAKSVAYLQRALRQALNSPTRIVSGNAITLPATTIKAIRQAHDKQLNAAQRSSLAKALNGEITADGNAALIDRHVKALVSFLQSVIARQEAVRTVNVGEYLAFKQGKANRSLPRSAKRFWRTVGDERVRQTHRTIPGLNAEGVDVGKPFQTPFGPIMYPPCEINCRCRAVVRWPDSEALRLAA